MKNGTIISILIIIALVIIGAAIYFFVFATGRPLPQKPQNPEQVTMVGTVICLPHKGSGPQTLECAFGLESNGNNYALTNIPQGNQIALESGKTVKVAGTLTSPDPNTLYDIAGAIDVTSLTPMNDLESDSPSATKNYTNQDPAFSFSYPLGWSVIAEKNNGTPWSQFSQKPGNVYATVVSPDTYLDGTNVGDIHFHVGSSDDSQAVASCLEIPENHDPDATKTEASINGTEFTKLRMTDAGAGNRYETVSYRAVKDGSCFAVEYTVHYGVLENYPKERHITDGVSQANDVAESIAQSFKFSD